MSTPEIPAAPDHQDLRGLARGLRQLFEVTARTLADDAGPSEFARQVTEHLGCDLTAVVPVTERFASWEHVNIQRGLDAYLASRPSGTWFGASGLGHRPREDMLSLLNMPSSFGGLRPGAANYGTAAVGPQQNAEVVMFGLVRSTAPDGAPVVIGIRKRKPVRVAFLQSRGARGGPADSHRDP
ncbi:MAG: hypothetical protein M3Z75_29895 [Actinomycetota bacterium]|nr:hypothetical protein [Actinomycetota bacterium]